ncbi:MAG: hypothetical protein ACYDCQ_22975 [Dehalococcoidia bacterium]
MTEQRFTVVAVDAGPNDDLSTETTMFEEIGAQIRRAGAPDENGLIEAVHDADALVHHGAGRRADAALPDRGAHRRRLRHARHPGADRKRHPRGQSAGDLDG